MKAIIFDFGNTIVRQDNLDWKKMEKAGLLNQIDLFSKRGFRGITVAKWSDSFYRLLKLHEFQAAHHRTEVSMIRVFQRLIFEYGLPSDITPFQLTQTFYLPVCQSRLLFEDTADTLKRLVDKGVPLGLISNTAIPGVLMDEVLQRLHVLEFFGFTFYSSDLGFRKPHPDMFELAAARLKLKPGQITMVGDQVVEDVKGAVSAGMQAVWINRGGTEKKTAGAAHCRTVRSLRELLTLLK